MPPKKHTTSPTKAPPKRAKLAPHAAKEASTIVAGKMVIEDIENSVISALAQSAASPRQLPVNFEVHLSGEKCKQLLAYFRSVVPEEVLDGQQLVEETGGLRGALHGAIQSALVWTPSASFNQARFSASVLVKVPDCVRQLLGLKAGDKIPEQTVFEKHVFEKEIVWKPLQGKSMWNSLYPRGKITLHWDAGSKELEVTGEYGKDPLCGDGPGEDGYADSEGGGELEEGQVVGSD